MNEAAAADRARQPADEARRLARLRELMVLDSAPEPLFDGIARLASEVCGTPIALVSLVDAERQWFKANVGLGGVDETPRDIAFCAQAIGGDALFEVPDASIDPRFAANPLVTGAPDIRFYAGSPLRLEGGERVGTLCVIDREPRRLDAAQERMLAALAALVSDALAMRRNLIERALAARSDHERALAASEAHHRAIVDGQTEMVALSDARRRLRYVNPAYARRLGFEPAALTGTDLLDRVDPAHRAAVDARLDAVLRTGESVLSENRNIAADGRVCWTEWTNRATSDAHGEPLVHAVGRDITDRKLAEEALRASRQMLQRMSRVAGVGGWEVDLASGAIAWSHETCRIHELPAGHVPTLKEAIGYYAPAARPLIDRAVQRAVSHGEPWDLELPLTTARGRPLWVRAVGEIERDDAGTAARLIGALQDITERKHLEDRLAEGERFMRQITDSLPVRIAYVDRDRRYRFVNQAHCQRFGRGRDDILGRTRDELTRGTADDAAVNVRVAAALGGEVQRFEFEERQGGELRCIESHLIPDTGEDGEVRGFFSTGTDITERKRIERELAAQGELNRITLHSIADAVVITDAVARVQYMNPVAEQLAGWSAADAAGQPIGQVLSILDEATRRPVQNPAERCLADNRVVALASDTLLVSRGGAEHGIEDTAAPLHGADGGVLGAVLVFRDVTARRRQAHEMTWRATHDALTGLANRAEFESRLGRLLDKARRDDARHALMAIDLDRFKLVNDACGHAAGDRLLCQVSALLRQCVRARDTVARLGGDEFGVILEQCTVEQARRVAQQICDRMEDFRFVQDERRFGIGASIGLVPLDARWADPAAALQAADGACYAAKHAGRNRVHIGAAVDAAAPAPPNEANWAARLRQALDENRFELHAARIEPLAAAPRGLRCDLQPCLREADGSRVAAHRFMPAAERLHLASRIDRWLVDAACARLAAAAAAGGDDDDGTLPVALMTVPLSAQSVADRAMQRRLLDAVTPLAAAALCFQIGEATVLGHPAEAADFVAAAHAAGVRVALGGLGAGTSSLGLLRSLPVDFLKIDAAIVRGTADDALDRVAVRCWRDAAHAIGATTIAEGVEQRSVLAALREVGVDCAQGGLLHRAEPLDALLRVPERCAVEAG